MRDLGPICFIVGKPSRWRRYTVEFHIGSGVEGQSTVIMRSWSMDRADRFADYLNELIYDYEFK